MHAANLLPFTPALEPTISPFRVWSNSRRVNRFEEERDTRDRSTGNEASAERKRLAKLYRKAKAWKSRNPRIMPQSAIRVLEALCFDFPNIYTGKLFPSHAAIARKAGLAVSTVKEALNKLHELGILQWQRRCVESLQEFGGFIMRQISNLYHIFPASLWNGYHQAPEDTPPPTPEYGATPLMPYGGDAALAAAANASSATEAGRACAASIIDTNPALLSEAERALRSLFSTITKTH